VTVHFQKRETTAMLEVLQTIREGIPDIFPDAMGFPIEPETPLNRIPEWDSMSSVNFKVFLEETFGVRIPDDLLEGGSTVGEVITFIQKGGLMDPSSNAKIPAHSQQAIAPNALKEIQVPPS